MYWTQHAKFTDVEVMVIAKDVHVAYKREDLYGAVVQVGNLYAYNVWDKEGSRCSSFEATFAMAEAIVLREVNR